MTSPILLFLFFLTSCHAQNTSLCISSCGNIKNITFPFRLKGDSRNCGNPKYELDCQNNRTILNLNSRSYYVQSIDYDGYRIRIIDSALEINNSCSFPLNSGEDIISNDIYSGASEIDFPFAFLQCLNPVNSSRYIDISFCSNTKSSISSNSSQIHRYIVVGDQITLSDLEESCKVETLIRATRSLPTNLSSLSSIHEAFAYGIELSWIYSLCSECYGHGECNIEGNAVVCRPYSVCYENVPLSELDFHCRLLYWAPYIIAFGGIGIAALLGLRFLCGLTCLIPYLVYKWKRRKNVSEYEYIDNLFEENFVPVRYNYFEIKKMTNNFKEKLGNGGNGTVFKGKLCSGPPIVVKMMNKSMSSEQEFISVMAALAKIRHDNVLQLIGFCLEGDQKRALVYDFMPNCSLQQHINNSVLSYEKMFEISLEVARGIDHLHRNIDTHTSHLGIKPHNILLDQDLKPKISDFGLVKLYPFARNMGPEFYYKEMGEISCKADVYSYGILLMEIVGKFKNVAEHTRPVSFPEWVYEQLRNGNEMELKNAASEEMEMVKKMVIVAFWCIQMLPEDRPPMSKVVGMLEGDAELLKMPPNPFAAPKAL